MRCTSYDDEAGGVAGGHQCVSGGFGEDLTLEWGMGVVWGLGSAFLDEVGQVALAAGGPVVDDRLVGHLPVDGQELEAVERGDRLICAGRLIERVAQQEVVDLVTAEADDDTGVSLG